MPFRNGYPKRNRYRNMRRTRRPFASVPAKKVPVAYKKSIKRAVADEIAKGRENKFAGYAITPTTIAAVAGTTTDDNVFSVMPKIDQGPRAYNSRLGNQITPKYLEIRGWCTLDMTDQDKDYDRVAMRIMVGFAKQTPLAVDMKNFINGSPLNNWSYALLKGTAGPQAFLGTLDDYQSPVNHEMFTLKAERRFTLMRPRIWNAPLTGDDFARSTAGSYKFFRMRIKCPKTLYYARDSDVIPKNFSPVLIAGYSLLNGSTPAVPPAAPKQVTISFTTNLSYEDA